MTMQMVIDEIAVDVHLYQFQSLREDKETLYVVSSLNNGESEQVRMFIDGWDHGGMDKDLFYHILEEGKMKEIKGWQDIDEPREKLDWLPLCTTEFIGNANGCRIHFNNFGNDLEIYLDELIDMLDEEDHPIVEEFQISEKSTITNKELVNNIVGFMAYDQGCTDSGIKDDCLKEECKKLISERLLEDKGLEMELTSYIHEISNPKSDYSFEDVKGFIKYLEEEFNLNDIYG